MHSFSEDSIRSCEVFPDLVSAGKKLAGIQEWGSDPNDENVAMQDPACTGAQSASSGSACGSYHATRNSSRRDSSTASPRASFPSDPELTREGDETGKREFIAR